MKLQLKQHLAAYSNFKLSIYHRIAEFHISKAKPTLSFKTFGVDEST
jgi:hypothetical protein